MQFAKLVLTQKSRSDTLITGKNMAVKEKKPTLDDLIVEVRMLRSAVIGLIGRDSEGEYKPEFVAKVLEAEKEPIVGEFKDTKSFLW